MGIINKLQGKDKDLKTRESSRKEILSYLGSESFKGAQVLNPKTTESSYAIFVEELAPQISEGLSGLPKEEMKALAERIQLLAFYDEKTFHKILGATLLLGTICMTINLSKGNDTTNEEMLDILIGIVNDLTAIYNKYA